MKKDWGKVKGTVLPEVKAKNVVKKLAITRPGDGKGKAAREIAERTENAKKLQALQEENAKLAKALQDERAVKLAKAFRTGSQLISESLMLISALHVICLPCCFSRTQFHDYRPSQPTATVPYANN